MAEALDQEKEAQAESEESFEVGERVVIREDFHSAYFRGLEATIAGPARKAGPSKPVWPIKLDVPPYETVMHGKYLMRLDEWEASPKQGAGEQASGSLLGRILPWRKR